MKILKTNYFNQKNLFIVVQYSDIVIPKITVIKSHIIDGHIEFVLCILINVRTCTTCYKCLSINISKRLFTHHADYY